MNLITARRRIRLEINTQKINTNYYISIMFYTMNNIVIILDRYDRYEPNFRNWTNYINLSQNISAYTYTYIHTHIHI